MKHGRAAVVIAISIASGATYTGAASAQSAQDLQRQIDQLQRQVDNMKKEEGGGAKAPVTADTTIQLYGHLDLSIDTMTKGMSEGFTRADGTTAVGKLGWQPDISSNLSYFGVRGGHD